jgi:hypothetical protein
MIPSYKDDEANTRTTTVLLMRIATIHAAHLGPGIRIRIRYSAADSTADSVRSLPTFEMQCVDCHNRASHAFELPDRAVNPAMAAGQIAAALSAFYSQNYADAAAKQASAIQAAGQALAAIYQRNVFSDLKVTWGTYPNNLGHTDDPGCFRCHDGSHATADQKTISQECSLCHQMVAVDETSPDILKTLELTPTQNH